MKAATQRKSRPRRRRKSNRPWLLFFRLMLWCLAAGILWCGYMLWLINGYSPNESYPEADAGIVLGAALWSDRPSPALKERLDYAKSLLDNGTVKVLVLSGGHGGRASTLSEAEGMRNYLVDKGVAEEKLLLEAQATSTYQNLVYSEMEAEAAGYDTYLVITHDYHAARAGEIARYADLDIVGVAGVKSQVLNQFYNDSREVLAFTKWKLDWLTLASGIRSPNSLL